MAYFVREHLAGAKIKTLLYFIKMMASGLQKTLSKKRKKKQGKPQSKDKNVLCAHLTETSVQNQFSVDKEQGTIYKRGCSSSPKPSHKGNAN